RTIRQRVSVEGIGLHTGAPAKLTFCPAPEGTGIYFVRRDMQGSPAISTQADRVTATSMATTLGGDAFSVSTVEHCLSTLAAHRPADPGNRHYRTVLCPRNRPRPHIRLS